MDDPVHGRHAAIYATPKKRLPPSFFLGLGVALAVHAGFAYYLLQHTFARGGVVIEEGPIIVDPIRITMDKPKPLQPKPEINIHKTPVTENTPVKAIPVAPTDKVTPTDGRTIVDALPEIPTGTAGTDTKPEPNGYVDARWTRFPDAEALTTYYPPRAMDDEVEGTATVQCTVLDTAGRVSCVAISEKPGGYGFGAATARMVQDKGRVDTSQGNVQVGSMLRQTVTWKLD